MSHAAMLLMLALSAPLHAQTMVEFGTLTGRAGATAGGAAAGKSVVDIFGKVGKTLGGAAQVGDVARPAPVAAPAAKAEPSPPPPPDLNGLVIGMARADLLKKVGKPSMIISSVDDATMVETCWYKIGTVNVTVVLRDGKVASISGPAQAAP